MYKMYYENTLFYLDTTPMEEYKVASPTLTLKANASGSLEFSMPSTNIAYNTIQRMKGLVTVEKNGDIIWKGRVLSEDMDFWKNKKIYVEGHLSCLNDTRQPQKVYKDMNVREFVSQILSIHNQKVEASKQFEVGVVTVNGNALIDPTTTNYNTTWEVLKSLVQKYKGYLYIRYESGHQYLDYRAACPRTSSQKIEFGVNLLDFTRNYDMSSLCTVLLPLGKTLASAGNAAVGDKIDAHLADGHYILYDENTDNVDIYYDPALVGSYSGSNTYVEVDAGKTYYISCRNNDNRIMWALQDPSGNLHSKYEAGSSGFTDLVEYKLEIPPSDVGGKYRLMIAGFGSDIQPRINSAIESPEEFDTYVTVENAADSSQSSGKHGSLYVVNEEAVTTYGWIEQQITWSNIEDPDKLMETAKKYLSEGQFDEMTLKVTAVDLKLMGVNADDIRILDEVQVVSEPHGLNKVFPVTELQIKIDQPASNSFTLGSKTEQTLSGQLNTINDELLAKINAYPSQSVILKSAQNNATQLLNTATSGILTFRYDPIDGHTTGMVLSNVADYTAEGAKGWLFNSGGIGYFPNGFTENVNVAITNDGAIVADAITTGIMSADRIRGGTMWLGHWYMGEDPETHQPLYLDGSLRVKDNNDRTIADIGLMENNTYGASITGTFTATGTNSSGPVVIHMQDGWIRGSDQSREGPSISVDTLFENEYGDQSRMVSIEGNYVAIVAPNLFVDDDRYASNLRRGISALVEIEGYDGTHTLTFVNGILVDWAFEEYQE